MNNNIQSQSLFYWKKHCNENNKYIDLNKEKVTILILLEKTLQYEIREFIIDSQYSHNPYFTGKNIAIMTSGL